ncbi:MAG: hypothetical protein AAGG81_01035 [Chlamydiota bacterium]
MTLAFNNIVGILEGCTHNLKEQIPNKQGFHCWMDHGHEVDIKMTRLFHKIASNKANMRVVDTATVTIEPPNEKLTQIITDYFLNEKISDEPDFLFFDSVTINGNPIITKK